jgi:NhaP-type Na+/H+ or K+/H+ antiporter
MHGGGAYTILFLIAALTLGAATRHLSRFIRLPYTVALLLIGIGLGAAAKAHWLDFHAVPLGEAISHAATIDPHLILFVFLPTLLFESAFCMDTHVFRRSVKTVLVLAVPGLIVATALTAVIARYLFPWSWSWEAAFMFGAVVSATDPVAVVALLKELGVDKRLGTLIEGESLFNDGTAIVVFMVFYEAVRVGGFEGSPIAVIGQFIWISAGGILLGIAIGAVTIWWIRHVMNDAMVEITVTIVAAYIAFQTAEQLLHVSGVLATVTLGLMLASIGRTRISPEVEGFLHRFWETAAYLANTLVFVLVGVVIAVKSSFSMRDVWIALGLYIGITIIRAAVVGAFYPFIKNLGYGLKVEDAVVLVWGGLRGAVGLALALVVAQDMLIPKEVGLNTLNLAAAVVVLTLVVNGTTMGGLIKRLKLDAVTPARHNLLNDARSEIIDNTQQTIDLLKTDRYLSGADWGKVRDSLPRLELSDCSETTGYVDLAFEARRRMLEAEKRSYWRQFHHGLLGPDAVRRLVEDADQALDRLAAGEEDPEKRHSWTVPSWLLTCQTVPLIGRWIRRAYFERLSFDYDVARGFAVAQTEIEPLLPQITSNSELVDELRKCCKQARDSVLENIRTMHEVFPEIIVAIETRTASRSVLNTARTSIRKLTSRGLLEEGEAERWIESVEHRMKAVADVPFEAPDKERLLREINWLSDLSPDAFATAMETCSERVFTKHDRLVEAGTVGDGLLILARGRVDVRIMIDGEEQTVDTLGGGAVIGEIAVLTETPRTASVIATTPVEAFWLGADELHEMMDSIPGLKNKLWQTAGARLAENMLRPMMPFSGWGALALRGWANKGCMRDQIEDVVTDRPAILMAGTASEDDGSTVTGPAVITLGKVKCSADAAIFVCPEIPVGTPE